jgi:hypothetical protein
MKLGFPSTTVPWSWNVLLVQKASMAIAGKGTVSYPARLIEIQLYGYVKLT